jgi:ABC-type lipoprotein export system ATPase subunit
VELLVTPALEAREAFRIYPSPGGATVALRGLSLTVDPGEIVVVLGPSGAGKTTLFRAIAGFDRLTAGTIRVSGTELARLGSRELAALRASKLGFLDQHYARSLSPDLTCRDSISLKLRLLGDDPREAGRAADELLRRVGLVGRGKDRPATLSGGEQQRVAVCASVAHRPMLLLADEPAGELDAQSAQTIYDLLGELAREAGMTALVVSHDPAAAGIADRVVEIRDGQLVEETLRGREPALVLSPTGWVRLPTALRDALGAPSRVVAQPRADELVLRGLGPAHLDEGRERRRDRSVSASKGRPAVVAALRSVAKNYRRGHGAHMVFEDLSHEVRAGRLLAVVGRSGSGKTTLLHLLAGLVRPTAGDVLLLDEPLTEKGRSELAALRRDHVALVTQQPGLVSYLSAEENVALGLTLRGQRIAPAARAKAALEEVGLGRRLAHRASSLSAGEQQRTAIARALAADPRLLLVDEPTARLDEDNARAIGSLLGRAAHETGVAVVAATHDPVLIALADEMLALERTPLEVVL